ncbi:unnamed protein product [Laminaria digitata]
MPSFREHPQTTPYRPTCIQDDTAHTPRYKHTELVLAAATVQLLWSFHHQATAVGGYYTRGRVPLFEEQIRDRDRRHGGCSASVSSAMLWQGYCCGRVLYAWEDATLRGADQRP